jgi:hypothetical protein
MEVGGNGNGRWMMNGMGIAMKYRWEGDWEYGNEQTGMGRNGNETLISAHLYSLHELWI